MVVLRGFSCWKMWPKVDVELMFWCSAYFWISDLLNLLEWETPWKTWFRAWTCWTCLRGHSYRDYRDSWHCHAALPQYCSCCQHRMWWRPAPETSDFTFPWFEGISMHDVHMMHGLHFFWMVFFLHPWFHDSILAFRMGSMARGHPCFIKQHPGWTAPGHQHLRHKQGTHHYSPSNRTLNCTRNSPEQHPLSNNKVTNCGTKLPSYEK